MTFNRLGNRLSPKMRFAMKNRLYTLRQSALVVGLTVSLLMPSFALPAEAQPKTVSIVSYSGEDIFKGLLLGDGPVAKMFPEIWNSPKIAAYHEQELHSFTQAQISAEENDLINRIKVSDPQFFPRFASVMQSGHRLKISAMLNEAGEHMKAVAPKSSIDGTYSVYLYVETAVAIAAVAVLVAAVVLVVVLEQQDSDDSDASLQRDVLINLIAERLSPANV
jgi:hypothetical protein